MSEVNGHGMSPGLGVGDKLGAFEVVEHLGSGGMGIVWKGYDRLLDRTVAIKQVAEAGGVDESLRSQLKTEAMMQKRVSHLWEGIVDVIDLIDDPRGLFLVMDFVDGPSLDRVLVNGEGAKSDGGGMRVLSALGVLRDVAKSLAVIHEAGIVHRDVKPGNILLGKEGPARLCDFGMAALDGDRGAADMGTAQYMAPELVRGGVVDGRADLYSLGMVAYEALAGPVIFERVFKAVLRDKRQRALRWMKWHGNERAVAPALHTLDDSIPEVLSELVGRLMAKDVNQRIGSALELLEAIRVHFSKSAEAKAARAKRMDGLVGAVGVGASGAGSAGVGPTGLHHSDGVATEALPKRKLLPWVLAGLLLVQGGAFGGYVLWKDREVRLEGEATRNAALGMMRDAVGLFKDQKYGEAQASFEKLAEAWGAGSEKGAGVEGKGDAVLGVSTMVYGWVSDAQGRVVRGRDALEAGELAVALDEFDGARELVDRAGVVELPSEAASLSELIGRMREDVMMRLAVVEGAMAIEEHLAGQAFDDARRRFALMRGYASDLGGVVLESENRVLAELGTRIEDQESQWRRSEVLRRAEVLMESEKLADAQIVLEEGVEKWPTDAGIVDLLGVVKRGIEVREAVRDSGLAAASGQTANAVLALQFAFDLEPTEELENQLRQLQSVLALETGRGLMDRNDLEGAIGKLRESAALFENAEAEELLDRLEANRDRHSIELAGDTAMAGERYEEAAKHYADALVLEPSPETQLKLNTARVRQHVVLADRNMRLGDLAMARGELQMAFQIDAEDAEARGMFDRLEALAGFEGMLDEAEKLRAQSQFGEAKRVLSKAIELAKATGQDVKAAEERRANVQYDQLVAQGRSAIEGKQGKEAMAVLLAAQKLRDTEVVRALIAEANGLDEG